MSDHPNPGNRYDYLNREAQLLHVSASPRRATPEFQTAQAHLRSLSPALSAKDIARNKTGGGTAGADTPPNTENVPPPESRYTTYNEGNLFRVRVPSNWRELASNDTVTFAPEGAYGTVRGQSVFTHGIEIGLGRTDTNDLRAATDGLIQSLQQSNPRLSRPSSYERASIGGREGLHTVLSNVSDATGGQEIIDVYTTRSGDGSLFYALGVAPRELYNTYSSTFRNVVRSIQFSR